MDLDLHDSVETRGSSRAPSATPSLPARLKILYVTTPRRTGLDLTTAFAADSATRVSITEAQGPAAGLEQLGQQVFDAVFVVHEPPDIDALELVEGLRAGGMEEPVIVLGEGDAESLAPLVYEVGADAYACVTTTTTRALLWMVARAVERHHLVQESRRLAQLQRQRVEQECDEAQRLLGQQRAILGPSPDKAVKDETLDGQPSNLPEAIVRQYQQILRTHVIMGSGNLQREIEQLTAALLETSAQPRDVIVLHTTATAQQIRGLGAKGSRHILARADLLIFEVLAQLSAGYRSRYLEAAGRRP